MLKSQEMRKLAPEMDPLRIGKKRILKNRRLWWRVRTGTAIREAAT
mgnify:CR=1 FL=1